MCVKPQGRAAAGRPLAEGVAGRGWADTVGARDAAGLQILRIRFAGGDRLQSRSQRENGEVGTRRGRRSVEVCAAAHFILRAGIAPSVVSAVDASIPIKSPQFSAVVSISFMSPLPTRSRADLRRSSLTEHSLVF